MTLEDVGKRRDRLVKEIVIPGKTKKSQGRGVCLLRGKAPVFMAVQVRLQNLPGLHGRKPVGDVLQRHHMAVSGLRRAERLW